MNIQFEPQLTKNKSVNFGIVSDFEHIWCWFNFNMCWSRIGKRDHAGFELSIDIVGIYIFINLYDHRHAKNLLESDLEDVYIDDINRGG